TVSRDWSSDVCSSDLHRTVLVNSDLDAVTAALNVKPGKIESKGHKSVRSRVANISEFLPEPLDPHTLRARIIDRIFEGGEPVMQIGRASCRERRRVVV